MESPSTPLALTLRAVAKHFRVGLFARRDEVLSSVNLDLHAGECLGLVGPNGSGKSTLLRIACGIDAPTAGAVELFGVDASQASARGVVGFVPEGAPFPKNLSAKLCLEICADLQGLRGRRARQQCESMLSRVGLHGVKTPLGRYSQGMLRRFALAQACVHEPQLLLLDEPTVGLDAEGHAVLEELIDEARGRGAALIVCSHQIEEALGWTDSIALLLDGSLRREARTWITAEGSVRLEIAGLDPAALDKLELYIAECGGRLLSRHPTTAALLRLYRESGVKE